MTDVYLKREIANALAAAYQNARQTADVLAVDREQARMYGLGYCAALTAVALFFGIELSTLRQELDPFWRER